MTITAVSRIKPEREDLRGCLLGAQFPYHHRVFADRRASIEANTTPVTSPSQDNWYFCLAGEGVDSHKCQSLLPGYLCDGINPLCIYYKSQLITGFCRQGSRGRLVSVLLPGFNPCSHFFCLTSLNREAFPALMDPPCCFTCGAIHSSVLRRKRRRKERN